MRHRARHRSLIRPPYSPGASPGDLIYNAVRRTAYTQGVPVREPRGRCVSRARATSANQLPRRATRSIGGGALRRDSGGGLSRATRRGRPASPPGGESAGTRALRRGRRAAAGRRVRAEAHPVGPAARGASSSSSRSSWARRWAASSRARSSAAARRRGAPRPEGLLRRHGEEPRCDVRVLRVPRDCVSVPSRQPEVAATPRRRAAGSPPESASTTTAPPPSSSRAKSAASCAASCVGASTMHDAADALQHREHAAPDRIQGGQPSHRVEEI